METNANFFFATFATRKLLLDTLRLLEMNSSSSFFFLLHHLHYYYYSPPLFYPCMQKDWNRDAKKKKVTRGCWCWCCPTNNALLTNFLLSSDTEVFVDKRRVSITNWRRKVQKTCTQRVCIPTELPLLHATVGGWVRRNPLFEAAPAAASQGRGWQPKKRGGGEETSCTRSGTKLYIDWISKKKKCFARILRIFCAFFVHVLRVF